MLRGLAEGEAESPRCDGANGQVKSDACKSFGGRKPLLPEGFRGTTTKEIAHNGRRLRGNGLFGTLPTRMTSTTLFLDHKACSGDTLNPEQSRRRGQ